ncbi:MAG: RNA polymerase sigma factor [Polyangiales bacterium]
MNHESVRTGTPPDHAPSIIDGCRRGDRASLGQVFRVESPYLERVLSRIVGPGADLEDLLQHTLEQAIHAFPSYRAEATVRTWLTRIAVRTAMHHLKQPARKRRVALEVIEGGLSEVASSRPMHEADARARLRVLHENLAQLDEKHRAAFVLYQVEGRSMDEVATLMESNLSTTKSRVMWARRKLLARLARDPRAREWLGELGTGDES